MAYVQTLGDTIKDINERVKTDPEIKNALRKYNGRTLVLEVYEDATYVFHVSSSGVSLEVNPQSRPDDMYAGMDIKRANDLVYRQKVSKSDVILGKIKHKNISFADIEFVKKLFERKQKKS